MKLSAVGVSSKKRLNTAWRVRWIVSCLSLPVQRTLQLETGVNYCIVTTKLRISGSV